MLSMVVVPSVSLAAEWRGSVDAVQIYTDNLTLAPGGFEEDAWVTRIEPSIGVTINAARLELDLDYSLEGLFYANNSDRNGLFSRASTYAVLGLIGDELWLRGSGLIDQVNLNPVSPLTNSNINITGNRSDVAIWSIGPQWQRSLFGRSELDAYFTAGTVNYNEPGAQDAKTLLGQASIRSSSAKPGDIGYELKYEFSQLDYQISGDVEVQSLFLQLAYRVNETFELTGMVGLDSDFANLENSSLTESRWEVGLTRKLGKNDFAFSFGERFWGPTYYFEWNRQQGENAHLRIAYNETPSTANIVALQKVPTGEGDGFDSPDSGLNRPGSARRFIRKRGDAGIDWSFIYTSFYIGLFWEQRDNIRAATDVASVPDEDAYGVTASISRELGHKTVFSAAVSQTTRELVIDQSQQTGEFMLDTDNLLQGSADINYELGTRTFAFLVVSYNDRKGTTVGLGNYSEFSVQLGLTRDF